MAKRRLTSREIYAARLAARKCGMCAQPLPMESCTRTCAKCLRNVKSSGQRLRAARKSKSQCPGCGASRASGRTFCADCLTKAKARYQNRLAQGMCVLCGTRPLKMGTKCVDCHAKSGKRARDYRDRLIVRAFNAYGGCHCACCGDTRVAFLTLDHIGGGGNRHRKQLRGQKGFTDIYQWLRKQGYPPGFRVLCMNCNWAIGKYGYCPHQDRVPEPFTFIA